MNVRGSYVVTGLIGFTLVFGMAFWWFQEHAFYDEIWSDEVVIRGAVYPVTDWRGITSESSPLKMRACFVLTEEFDAPPSLEPMPLVAPGWFKCFNAQFITENLANGYGKAYVVASGEPHGFDRIIAVFPGGNTYMWRQPSEETLQ